MTGTVEHTAVCHHPLYIRLSLYINRRSLSLCPPEPLDACEEHRHQQGHRREQQALQEA